MLHRNRKVRGLLTASLLLLFVLLFVTSRGGDASRSGVGTAIRGEGLSWTARFLPRPLGQKRDSNAQDSGPEEAYQGDHALGEATNPHDSSDLPLAQADATFNATSNFPQHYAYPLHIRADSTQSADFTASRSRGCKLNSLDTGTIPANLITKYTDYAWFTRCGYELVAQSPDELEAAQNIFDVLEDALKSLSISTTATDKQWHAVKREHTKEKSCKIAPVVGKKYPATWSHFENFYNPRQRVILAFDNLGPAHVYDPPAAADLVPLRQLSDVWWLDWQRACSRLHGDNVRVEGVKYVLRYAVQSEESKKIIGEAIGGDIKALKGWLQAAEYGLESAEAQALLGTPNGRAVGWFLAQHKRELGQRRSVQSIKVWDSGANDDYREAMGPHVCMMFVLSDPE